VSKVTTLFQMQSLSLETGPQ